MRTKKSNLRNLLMCIAFLFAVMIVPNTVQAADSSNENYMDISKYRSGSTYTYPTKDGYVFAGWYQDANYEKAIGTKTKNGYAYAKFVDENVLSVKCQISSDTELVEGQTTDLRMITTVDNEYYTSVSFRTRFDKYSITTTTDKAYKYIYGYWNDNEEYYEPSVFSSSSSYFVGYTVSGFPYTYYDSDITITPMWTTLDGTIVSGIAKTFTITDAVNVLDGNVAKIGSEYYTTLASAVTAANTKSEDVTIELLSDVAISDIKPNNTNGKNITFNGNGHTITANPASATTTQISVDIQQTAGEITFNNMQIVHDSGNALIRTRTGNSDEISQNITVNMNDVVIVSANDTEKFYPWGVFNLADAGTVNLNLTRTNVTLKISTTAAGNKFSVIRICDAASQTATINMTDSSIDATGAELRAGISVCDKSSTKANITLINSQIKTKNQYPICVYGTAANQTCTVSTDSQSFYSVVSDETMAKVYAANDGVLTETEYNVVAKVGVTYYTTLADAVTAANAATEDVTIELLSDVAISDIKPNNTNGKNITFNGNGHTITANPTSATSTQISVDIQQTAGEITFNNMQIVHDSGNALIRTRTASSTDTISQSITVNMNDVVIVSANDTEKFYPWGVFNLADAGTVNLNLTRTNVTLKISTTAAGNNFSVIRVCDTASQTANITMVDSIIDATKAEQRAGISVCSKSSTKANITLINSQIKTKNQYPMCVYGTAANQTCTVSKDSQSSYSVVSDETMAKVYAANSGTLTINDYYVAAKIEAENEATLVTEVKNTYYTTLTAAVSDANAYGEDVTIELINNITNEEFGDNYQIDINNQYGYTITIDGNGKNITTDGDNNCFEVRQSGEFAINNVNFYHQGTNALMRTRQAITLTVKDVNIYATEDIDGVFDYYLFHVSGPGTSYLNMNNVDVVAKNSYEVGADNVGVIQTGWEDGEDQHRTVYITMEDCDFDLKEATGRSGIKIMDNTTAYIDMTNSTIATKDIYCIRPNGQSLTYTGCTFSSLDADYNASPIEGYNAMIGNTCYTLADAMTLANAATEDTTIKLIGDTGRDKGVSFSSLTFGSNGDDATGKTTTIDGNGHSITTSGTSNSMQIYQANGTVELKNLTIYHKGTNALVRTRSAVTLNVTDVDIVAKNEEADAAYQAAVEAGTSSNLADNNKCVCYDYLFNLSGTSGNTYLNMNGVDVTVTSSVAGNSNNAAAIIRNGIAGKTGAKAEQAYITLNDCNFDLTGASNRVGIYTYSETDYSCKADIKMTNTNIATFDEYCIRPNNQSLTISTDCELTFENTVTQPIKDYAAVVDTTDGTHIWYNSLQNAFTGVADYTDCDVVITMWRDENTGNSTDLNTVDEVSAAINSADNTLTFDGNGYTRTMPIGSSHMFVFRKAAGKIVIKNLNMNHLGYRYAIRIDNGIQLDLENVDLVATQDATYDYTSVTTPSDVYKYSLIYFTNWGVEATLNMTDVNITMNVSTKGAVDDNNAPINGVICTGDSDHSTNTKTININMTNTVIDATGTSQRPGICVTAGTTANITMDNSSIKTNDYYAIYSRTHPTNSSVTADTNLSLTKDSVVAATDSAYNNDVYGGMSIGGALVNWAYSDATYTNRVLMVSDVHWMPDVDRDTYAANNNLTASKLSVAFGNILGYTSTQRMDFLKADISQYINALSDKSTVKGILTLGDLSTDNYLYSGMTENYVQKYKTNVMDVWTAAGYPAYALAGNHDSYPNSIWNSDVLFDYDREYYVELGDAIFVMLDTYSDLTSVDGSGSDYTGVNTTWLENVITANSDKQIYICSHYIDTTADNTAFADVLAKYDNVVSMFMGHAHGNTLSLESTLNNEFLMNVSAYSYSTRTDNNGDGTVTYNFQYFDEKWAWGFAVLEWNDTEAHYYHMKYPHTYTGIDWDNKDAGTQSITYPTNGAPVIEDEITIKFK